MRKISFIFPTILILTACGPGASDSELKANKGPAYLALGDSISFGYSPLVKITAENVANGGFIGYPEVLAEQLGYSLSNASCTGESSASLIDKTAKDNGCHSGDFPLDRFLKVAYEDSQLDYAVEFLSQNPDAKLVTISIGGNDLLIAETECNSEAVPVLCKIGRVPSLVVNFGKNLVQTIKSLRSTGYKGDIVFVTNYARDYKDGIQKIALGTLNAEAKTIGHLYKFKVASGFEAFDKATKTANGDSCAAGLLIALPEGGCNQHPSELGRVLLADTVSAALTK